jgi:hypothetical protein
MSKLTFDLDEGRYMVRDKSDLTAREEELGFTFRAFDRDRWDQLVGRIADFMYTSSARVSSV